MEAGHDHAGLIFILQKQRLSAGNETRRLLAMQSAFTLPEMTNRTEYLSNW
jgi:hypothetical protein